MPDLQRGRASLKKEGDGWRLQPPRDFREMADPTVIRFRDRWYLFPSCGMLWHSGDLLHWTHHPIEPFDPGYAPTVVQHRDWLYLTASGAGLWCARHPLGPWDSLGPMRTAQGKAVPGWWDPMLFADDGALYAYYGSGAAGIFGVRLQAQRPTRFAGAPVRCVVYDPAQPWQRFGEHHQDAARSWIEGAWMTKHRGRYYLQFSAPGTEWKEYAVGYAIGDRPLGPFRPAAENPVLRHRGGLLNGCGHHSLVAGPDGGLWCFYTVLVRIAHKFERRIAMDRARFTRAGKLEILGPTETPQYAPGAAPRGDVGWVPLSVNQPATASSFAPGHEPAYAVDQDIRTWWEAKTAAPHQWLQVDLERRYQICAARLLFADCGLAYAAGRVPGPYRYRLEGSLDGRRWQRLFDGSRNTVDRQAAYHAWAPQPARFVRVILLGVPRGLRAGLWEWTVFGQAGII